MDEKMYSWVLWGFLSVSAVLIVLFVVAAGVDLHRRVSTVPSEERVGAAGKRGADFQVAEEAVRKWGSEA